MGHLKDLKHDIGAELNKATEAIEEHNPTLEGVLVSIDFNIKNKLSDQETQGSACLISPNIVYATVILINLTCWVLPMNI